MWLPIPVFHDDQHGTAIVVLAALRTAGTVTGRSLAQGRAGLTPVKQHLAVTTNRRGLVGSLHDALVGADAFVGVSAGAVAEATVAQMAPNAIIFALANPNPEVDPTVAHRHAAVVATGRSDLPNQINNVLAFPGMFAGAFDAGATTINENMKLAAADALCGVVAADLRADHIVPSPFDPRVVSAVAAAVAGQARVDGVMSQSVVKASV